MEAGKPTMDESHRRGKFSILLWPSLYSLRSILLLQLVFVLLAGFTILIFHISRQDERQLLGRAAERVRAIAALKLSGVETWQWKRELKCENSVPDCLKLKISFAPAQTPAYTEKATIAEPCRICHEKAAATGTVFYASFETIPAGIRSRVGEWLTLSLIAAVALGLLAYLLRLRSQRLRSGICVVAFEHDPTTEREVKKFLKDLFSSRRYAYYAETAPRRLRIATTPQGLLRILTDFREILERNRGSLRAVALHADPRTCSVIPVDTLRAAYQFLAHVPQRTYLIQEPVAEEFGTDYENGRRLVFKNKSGASLKFIPWNPK